jgi:hypothetical protein
MREGADVYAHHVMLDTVDVTLLTRPHGRPGNDFVLAIDKHDGVVLGVGFSFHGLLLYSQVS